MKFLEKLEANNAKVKVEIMSTIREKMKENNKILKKKVENIFLIL